jgi:hypothetical protein
MSTTYVVTAPLVSIKVPAPDGGWQYQQLLRGAIVPEGAHPDSIKHHLDGDMIVDEKDEAAEALTAPAGTPVPGEEPNVNESDPTVRAARVRSAAKTSKADKGDSDN